MKHLIFLEYLRFGEVRCKEPAVYRHPFQFV